MTETPEDEMTYTNGSEIEVGDWIVGGEGEGRDWGQVTEIDGDDVTVAWRGSEQTTTQDASIIARCDAYTSHADARDAYAAAYTA